MGLGPDEHEGVAIRIARQQDSGIIRFVEGWRMSRTVTLQVPDEIYEVLEERAKAQGRDVTEVVVEWLAENAPRRKPPVNETTRKLMFKRLQKYVGTWGSGDSRSADNDKIDRILAEEYGKDI